MKNNLFKKALFVGLLALPVFASGCSKEESKQTLTGCHYTTVLSEPENESSAKRGCDLFVILNTDKSIYTIALDDDSPYQCADMQILWSIKSSGYFTNLGTLGIDGINKLSVEIDETTKLPTDKNGDGVIINGMNQDWLVPNNPVGSALVVLALQNAFTKVK